MLHYAAAYLTLCSLLIVLQSKKRFASEVRKLRETGLLGHAHAHAHGAHGHASNNS